MMRATRSAIRRMNKHLATLSCLLLALLAPPLAGADDEILPAREAYRYTITVAEGHLAVRYDIAPGYYLYRDRLGFASLTQGVTVGAPAFPAGEDHEDDYFGHQVIYRGPVTIPAKLDFEGAPREFDVELRLQGCADAGLCYPPQKWKVHVQAPVQADAPKKGFDLRRLLGRESLQEGDLLPADEAFRLSASSERADQVTLRWQIADGYYLYRDKVKVTAPDGGAQPGTPAIPAARPSTTTTSATRWCSSTRWSPRSRSPWPPARAACRCRSCTRAARKRASATRRSAKR